MVEATPSLQMLAVIKATEDGRLKPTKRSVRHYNQVHAKALKILKLTQ
jgi:hypothetical protein